MKMTRFRDGSKEPMMSISLFVNCLEIRSINMILDGILKIKKKKENRTINPKGKFIPAPGDLSLKSHQDYQ